MHTAGLPALWWLEIACSNFKGRVFFPVTGLPRKRAGFEQEDRWKLKTWEGEEKRQVGLRMETFFLSLTAKMSRYQQENCNKGRKLDPRRIQEIGTFFLLRILAMKIVVFVSHLWEQFFLFHSWMKGWTVLFTGNYLLNWLLNKYKRINDLWTLKQYYSINVWQ